METEVPLSSEESSKKEGAVSESKAAEKAVHNHLPWYIYCTSR